jgi:UDP-N-acetylmuramate--alanine ligase
MIKLKNIQQVYLIGIGGIGMSALARYFNEKGLAVSGYDRTPSFLTRRLASEGIKVSYDDDPAQLHSLPDLVIYTPAIPAQHTLLTFFRQNGLPLLKRSEALQQIVKEMFCITVAGTHGKTTISTLIAHILRESGYGCNAFLGGIAVNYDTNYWCNDNQVAVIEADEYDRSFLKLEPDIAVLTAMDADHLDVYGTKQAMQEAYIQYTRQIKAGGTLICKYGLDRPAELGGGMKITYSLHDDHADYHVENLLPQEGSYTFDIRNRDWTLRNIILPIGGIHNVENAVAATAAGMATGIDPDKIRSALASFLGVKRRFEYIVRTKQQVYIDDYAHHPEELDVLIASARSLFPGRPVTLIFQPHLYSRTRDLADDFARVLDKADLIFLLPVYPAREEPIAGVTSLLIADKMKNKQAYVLNKKEVLDRLTRNTNPLIITAGAGDINQMTEEIKNIYEGHESPDQAVN